MLRAHIQAWVWQDEWVGLTMEDIRNIERETQELLKKTMAGDSQNNALSDSPSQDANLSSAPAGVTPSSGAASPSVRVISTLLTIWSLPYDENRKQ